jgi:hypothetical protein
MAEFDPSVPSIARVYDYFLGGKDNFASDRALADRMIEMAPLAPVITRENRQFLRDKPHARCAGWLQRAFQARQRRRTPIPRLGQSMSLCVCARADYLLLRVPRDSFSAF